MSDRGKVLSSRILREVGDIQVVVKRAIDGFERAERNQDDLYLDAVALNLHAFYSAIERIFEKIANEIDESVPGGANWHRELLDQMTLEIDGIRPAVLSIDLKEELEDYRGLRHVVRNVYTFHLNPEKLANLVAKLPGIMSKVEAQLTGFARFLQGVGSNL